MIEGEGPVLIGVRELSAILRRTVVIVIAIDLPQETLDVRGETMIAVPNMTGMIEGENVLEVTIERGITEVTI